MKILRQSTEDINHVFRLETRVVKDHIELGKGIFIQIRVHNNLNGEITRGVSYLIKEEEYE